MCRNGDQHYVAVGIAAVQVISADGEQPGVFALGAAVRLQRTGAEAGYLAEVITQFANYLLVAKGCRPPNSGQLTGISSVAAFSFMVQLPSDIIEVLSDRSLFSRYLR